MNSDADRGIHVGYFYTWWSGDPLPPLDPINGFELTVTDDVSLLERISDLSISDIQLRIELGNRPYVAWIDDQPAAYGWSAWKRAEIGELGVDLILPQGDRYLWDFVTLPEFRGRGIYPHMLQGIILAERSTAERFWIGHDLGNEASARGIAKAGLPVIGEVWVRNGTALYVGRQPEDRARMAAGFLGLPFEMADDL
jgi:GNAT superfamily N-acetyltransferase